MRLAIGLVLMGAALAGGCDRASAPAEQGKVGAADPAAPAAADTVTPDEAAPAAGPVAAAGAIDRSHRGEPAPAAALVAIEGARVDLATYRGKPLLLNLWATWCAPCIAEMPTLDRVAGRLAGTLAVVAANQGDDAGKVQAFLAKTPLAHARPLLDAEMAISLKLGANLPTTILYDRAGKELWRATGGRDWASPASLKLIGEAG